MRVVGQLELVATVLTKKNEPAVYVALERIQMVKVAAVILLFIIGAVVAVGADAWRDPPQNLVQSNWIRDKRFGMGAYVPHIENRSPANQNLTG